MGPMLRAAFSVALLAACNTAPPPAADASPDRPSQDRPDVTDATAATDVPARQDAADVTDAREVTEVTDATELTDVSDATELTDAPQDVLRNGCPSLVDPVSPPDGGADTWNDYARGFFAQWCTRCHSSTLMDPSARGGAPPGFDWDQEAAVRLRLDVLRRQVGVVNAMPFNAPLPSCEERRRFVAWIDRGAP